MGVRDFQKLGFLYEILGMVRRLNSLSRAMACIFISMLLAACTPTGRDYQAVGIGTTLYRADIKKASNDLETYLGYLCHSAVLATDDKTKDYPMCHYSMLNNAGWRVLVHTGFNDIDQRCDSYLAWLDNRRARQTYGASLINRSGPLTETILNAINPGISGVTIAAISQAFGFASETYEDYHDLIYRGIELSTIKSIVSERRLAFRKAVLGETIAYKPDAVYFLRNYLRICTPYTITMDANTYALASATGSDLPSHNDAEQIAGVTVRKAKTADSVGGTTNVPDPEKTKKAARKKYVAGLQQLLCIAGNNGNEGLQTKTTVMIFQQHHNLSPVDGNIDRFATSAQGKALLAKGNAGEICNSALYLNTYELSVFAKAADAVSFNDKLVKLFPDIGLQEQVSLSSDINSAFRSNIALSRQAMISNDTYNYKESLPDGRPHVTFQFLSKINALSRFQ